MLQNRNPQEPQTGAQAPGAEMIKLGEEKPSRVYEGCPCVCPLLQKTPTEGINHFIGSCAIDSHSFQFTPSLSLHIQPVGLNEQGWLKKQSPDNLIHFE